MDYHDQIINIQMPQDDQIRATIKAENVGEYAVVLAYKYGHRDARYRAAEIAAQADARIAGLSEDAATFRHLLNIAQQVYGFELIGQAFTEINSLRADLESARREVNKLKATLVTAREEGKL